MPQFLSSEWIDAAKQIRAEHDDDGPPPAQQMKMNLVITDCPDEVGEGNQVKAHMDTSEGTLKMDLGHLDVPELTVTVGYETAKSIFVDQDPEAAMQAFMSGRIRVQGDMAKLIAMQSQAPHPEQKAIAAKVQAITD